MIHNAYSFFHRSAMSQIALLLILTITFWATGAPSLLSNAKAANLTNVSDTLSDSDLGVTAEHTVRFTIQNALNDTGGSDQIYIDLDPDGDNFNIGALSSADFTGETGISVVSSCTASASEFTLTATTSDSITLTICSGDTVATSTAVSFVVDNDKITNPGTASSYIVRVQTLNQGSTVLDQADTRVVILDDVDVTAKVSTIFTFTVTGLATSTNVNGETTTGSTTPTVMAFNTLDTTASSSLGQRLTVNTNARNGFSVTVQEAQNLTSSTGADIDLFIDGATTSVPVAWQAPASTMNFENTYGHWGVTSSDNVTSSTTAPGEFGTGATPLYAGNFNTAREVFYHNGPVNGTVVGEGYADVAYKVQIGNLQEAGTDYNTTIWYVATPTF